MDPTLSRAVAGEVKSFEDKSVGDGRAARWCLAVVRISLGWIFLWAFLDKLFGLGYGTSAAESWVAGSSPTAGYLSSVRGPFASLFSGMLGQPWVDWMYMCGMAGLGVALTLGVGLRAAAAGAVAMLGMLWLSSLPLQTNPFMDQHLIYLAAVFAVAATRAGDTWGLGRWWSRTRLVRTMPFLR